MLSLDTLPAMQRALVEARLDGWLVYDFQGANPIAAGVLGLEGFVTRRIFVWIPASGVPTAVGHAIEPGPWRTWPAEWEKASYSSWRSLESQLAALVGGKRIAMEYSAGDAVPYLDRVPAGVIEMIRVAGATEIVSSGELVTQFNAAWDASHIASHERAAGIIRTVALDALQLAGDRARIDTPITEHGIMTWILDRFERAGVSTDHGPIVAAGANAANPHYEPSQDRPRPVLVGDVLLIDLFAREAGGVWADQTWMASVGEPSPRAVEVWSAIRDARDAAIRLVLDEASAQHRIRGGDVDDAARAVITDRGFGEFFTHRTGHSIDPRSLHGSGPHLDNLETREERLLVPGVAFSIEPGIYIPGEIGMRTEVNAYLLADRAVITPVEYQRELLVV